MFLGVMSGVEGGEPRVSSRGGQTLATHSTLPRTGPMAGDCPAANISSA